MSKTNKKKMTLGRLLKAMGFGLILMVIVIGSNNGTSPVKDYPTTNEGVATKFDANTLQVANAPSNSNQTDDEWPMFRGSLNHTGVANTIPIKGGRPTWTTTEGINFSMPISGEIMSSPVVANGSVFGGCGYSVICLNATTGVLKWNYTTGDYVESTPAVAGDRVIAGSRDKFVYCLNATNGAYIWKYQLNGRIRTSSPCIANGRVYIGDDAHAIWCLDINIGAPYWCYVMKPASPVYSSPAIAGGRLYVISDKLYCLDAMLGSSIWNSSTDTVISSSPTISGGCVYYGTYNNGIRCVNATTGQSIWNYSGLLGLFYASSPAISGGHIYIGGLDGNVYCFDATSGAKLWNYTTKYVYNVDSSPAISNGYLYVQGMDNSNLYCLNASTGKHVWNYSWLGGSFALTPSPAIANGHVYISTSGGFACLPMIYGNCSSFPQNIQATRGNGQVMLSWQPPANNGGISITGYKIYQGTWTGGEILVATIGNTTTIARTGLLNGQAYFFKITALNDAGESPFSFETNATPATVPTIPRFFAAISGNTSITLNWVIPSDNGGSAIIQYKVFRGSTTENKMLIATTGCVSSYLDTGLTNGMLYHYTIAAVNGVGTGTNSTEIVSTPATIASAPLSLSVSSGDGKLVLSWSSPATDGGTPIIGYRIYQGTSSGGETLLETIEVGLNFTVSGLINGQIYYLKVSAINAAGEGASSIEVSGKPDSSSSPSMPGYPFIFVIGLIALAFGSIITKKFKNFG